MKPKGFKDSLYYMSNKYGTWPTIKVVFLSFFVLIPLLMILNFIEEWKNK